ncbi:hypothetical protein CVD25_19740 [Bacillus canaveralius]|uniref:Competence protein n=1 Tax=Bacillus canaveralius TaxID=1403243 RepID=A0A2N5GIS9_9BACI|nr:MULTISPECIES: competence protein ComK [Bacillus]PLR80931.1 hypothetical protein CU635_16855 [Bacillus canaveralius]PLR81693.1 hypothetical protein CVD23_18115 [Bacillus sp. V33-4]PLR91219.1 hypothetical protein CVD25_19740 [Bacillus canaveralius]RSK52683.1 hypothetical protein EJA13_10520 [Bacillus canaveralius]
MDIVRKYLVNRNTSAVLPDYDRQGRLWSQVIEGKKNFLVKVPPRKLLNECLEYYGDSMIGAVRGTRAILGNIRMAPIKIHADVELYWFPTLSPRKNSCIWLTPAHIIDFIYISENRTEVVLTEGNTVTIDMTIRRLIKKRQVTYTLKSQVEERKNRNGFYSIEQGDGIQLIKDPKGVNYIRRGKKIIKN